MDRWSPRTETVELAKVESKCYDFHHCALLAEREAEDGARWNPDNYVSFAVAMSRFLRQWDWSKGYAQKVCDELY
jgi:hypothetical protein